MNQNRLSDIKRIIRNAASALTAFAALSGCAAIGNPDGGPYDENPPRVTSSHPKNGATGFNGHKVTIDFNEFIKLENANEKVVISPPQTEQPEIKVTGKKIQVEFFDSLIPNTTYSIDFADGIVDNNENNPMGDYCFRFSTGNVIDSLEVSGYVLNAEDLEPLKGMTVGLHSDLSDSAFMTKRFERVSRTDAYGHFTIRGIAPGKYRIYAVMDMDQTSTYSQRNEKIAWADSVIVPTSELRIKQDSIFDSNGVFDTVLYVPYTKFLPDDITLLAFTPEPVQQYMTSYERPKHERFKMQFALPLDSMPLIKGINFDETDAYILQHSQRFDTLVFWMKDTAVYYKDTLQLSVTYLATDTAGMLSPTTDTLKLITPVSHKYLVKDAARKAEEAQKELDKKIRRLERSGDSLGIVNLLTPKTEFLKHKLKSGSGLRVTEREITLDFEEPVTFLSDTAVHLYQKADSIWKPVPYEIEQDSVNILRYYIYGEWKPGETFRINIDSASIQGLYGLHNAPVESTLRFTALDQFSTLTVNVSNPKPGYTVRLLDNRGKTVRTGTLENGSVDFFLLTPATYYVSMYHDANGNGKWDTGDYETKRHAESVWYIPRSFTLKQDWTHETDYWNVNELPISEQKPEALSKEISKKKEVNTHKKNVERLEKKASQKESEKKKKERKRNERKERRESNKAKYRAIRAQAKQKNQSQESTSADDSETVAEPLSESGVDTPDVQEVATPNQ